jgi:hypothetical protein
VENKRTRVGFEILTAVVVNCSVFWDMERCSPLKLFFNSEDGGDVFLRNVGWLSADCTALYTRRYNCSKEDILRV